MPGTLPSGEIIPQQVRPAKPFSLPTQRTSGPTSLKITALGCSLRTTSRKRGQSYSCFLPFGPSPQAPSHQTSKIGP